MCERDVIAEEIFVTSILQPQSWIQINWTWLCVSHIRILLGLRWIDTYFILGDKKITVDLNSIRCRLDRCCIKLSNTIMRTLREHLLKMLILSEDKAYFVMDLNTHHLLGWVDLSNFIEVNITPARDGRVGLWCDLVCWINILPQDSVICSSWMDRTGVFLLNLHV